VRAAAYLVVHSTDQPPDALAAKVGMEPDDAWHKGETRVGPSGIVNRRPAPTHAIRYESNLDETRSPTEHAAALARRLQPVEGAIRSLVDSGATAVVRIVEHSQCDNVEAQIEPEALRTFAAMGAAVGFDYYVVEDEDD
jgi:hypothetical protein